MPGTFVFWYLSTIICPRELVFTPVTSRLITSVAGSRPIAQIKVSTVVSRPSCNFKVSEPSAFLTTSSGNALVCNWIPSCANTSTKVSTINGSWLRNGACWRTNKWVSLPKLFKTPANSTAIYPAPTTATRFGNSFKANTPFESIPYSAPFTAGILGRPPVAIKIWSAVTNSVEPSA